MKTVRWHGETIAIDKLVRHYRQCARWWPASAALWRTLTRTAIAAYREQAAERAEQREAA